MNGGRQISTAPSHFDSKIWNWDKRISSTRYKTISTTIVPCAIRKSKSSKKRKRPFSEKKKGKQPKMMPYKMNLSAKSKPLKWRKIRKVNSRN